MSASKNTASERKKFSLKKNDKVIVIAGKDKGKTGEVMEVLTKSGRIKVKDVNVVTRHVKPSQKNPQGGTTKKEAAIDISNVMLADPKTGKPTRIGKIEKNGKWLRVAKKSGTVLEN